MVLRRATSITMAIGGSGPWKSRLFWALKWPRAKKEANRLIAAWNKKDPGRPGDSEPETRRALRRQVGKDDLHLAVKYIVKDNLRPLAVK